MVAIVYYFKTAGRQVLQHLDFFIKPACLNRITARREEQETQIVSSKQVNVTFLIEEWQISLETVSFHFSERTKKLGIYCNVQSLATTSSDQWERS